MIWDFVLDRNPSIRELSVALARGFGARPVSVLLFADGEELPDARTIDVVVGVQLLGGEFPCHLQAYLYQNIAAGHTQADLASKLARDLKVRCLISDDSVNPYTRLLVSADDDVRLVAVDVDRLDGEGIFCLSEYLE